MKSLDGVIFFIINIIENFGAVFLDNGYYNKAIAASLNSAVHGYILGGLAWFAVQFLTGTTMGLAAIVLENNPAFPTYPNRLSSADITAGLTFTCTCNCFTWKNWSNSKFYNGIYGMYKCNVFTINFC